MTEKSGTFTKIFGRDLKMQVSELFGAKRKKGKEGNVTYSCPCKIIIIAKLMNRS